MELESAQPSPSSGADAASLHANAPASREAQGADHPRTDGKRRGRPRKNPNAPDPKKLKIVQEAKKLWSAKGYAHTTIAQIAKASGMNSTSIYYHFPSKEATLEYLCRFDQTIATIKAIAAHDEVPLVRLASLVTHDVYYKCRLPFDFIELETVAAQHPTCFQPLSKVYRCLFDSLVSVLEEGMAQGSLRTPDAQERVGAILATNDGLQHYYHARKQGTLLLNVIGFEPRDASPFEMAALAVQETLPPLMTSSLDSAKLYARMRTLLADVRKQTQNADARYDVPDLFMDALGQTALMNTLHEIVEGTRNVGASTGADAKTDANANADAGANAEMNSDAGAEELAGARQPATKSAK